MKLSITHSLVLILAVGTSAFFWGREQAREVSAPQLVDMPDLEQHQSEIWTCSMDPQVRLPEFGACPICGMDLILGSSDAQGQDEGQAVLSMSAAAMERAKIQTSVVKRRKLQRQIALVGRVALDETRVSTITSWVEGRLDRLYVDFTGTRLRAGDHVAEIYSPTLYSAQEELLQAVAAAKRVAKSDLDLLRQSTARTLVSARERLRLFGLDAAQIDGIIATGKAEQHVTLHAQMDGVVIHKAALEGMFVKPGSELVKIADLSRVWVLLDAFESDLGWLRFGQRVLFTVEAYPGESFEARIAFVDPIVNPQTRTIQVRLSVDNQAGLLKPDMFVSALVEAQLSPVGRVLEPSWGANFLCPMHPEVGADSAASCSICGMDLVPSEELGFASSAPGKAPLAVPDTAPLFTGKRSIVYVRLADHEQPTFEGREVVLGPHAGDWYVVLDGLEEGAEVVVNGNFKIDAELQIRARPSMMRSRADGGLMPPTSPAVEPAHHVSAAPKAIVKPDGSVLTEVIVDLDPIETMDDFRAGLGALVQNYLALQMRLTQDGFESQLGEALIVDLEALQTGGLSAHELSVWNAAALSLMESSREVAQAESLDAARVSLEGLSDLLVRAIERFGLPGQQAAGLSIFHCPMAFGNRGAAWLGASGELLNPYFGSSMLHCGTTLRQLGQAPKE